MLVCMLLFRLILTTLYLAIYYFKKIPKVMEKLSEIRDDNFRRGLRIK